MWWDRVRPGPLLHAEAPGDAAARVVLRGAVDAHAAARLGEALARLRAQGAHTMEIDLTAVVFLSRDAVWLLLNHVREEGSLEALRLVGASGQPEYTLRRTGLGRTLH